jgi:hypothetical protein
VSAPVPPPPAADRPCRSCGRPFRPTHDVDSPGPTSRHPFFPVPLGRTPAGYDPDGTPYYPTTVGELGLCGHSDDPELSEDAARHTPPAVDAEGPATSPGQGALALVLASLAVDPSKHSNRERVLYAEVQRLSEELRVQRDVITRDLVRQRDRALAELTDEESAHDGMRRSIVAFRDERDEARARLAAVRALADYLETEARAGRVAPQLHAVGALIRARLDGPAEAPANDADMFGTTCAGCGVPITDERPSVGEAPDGSGPMHAGHGEPCVCGTAFTCLAHDHEDDDEMSRCPNDPPCPHAAHDHDHPGYISARATCCVDGCVCGDQATVGPAEAAEPHPWEAEAALPGDWAEVERDAQEWRERASEPALVAAARLVLAEWSRMHPSGYLAMYPAMDALRAAVAATPHEATDTEADPLGAFADDIERRMPGLRDPDPLSDWGRGVAWAVDRARNIARPTTTEEDR